MKHTLQSFINKYSCNFFYIRLYYIFMIPITIDRLVPNENYLVVVKWNSDSSFKFDNEYRFFGTFVRLSVDKKRTKSFDSGLEILLTPSRTNAIFSVNGRSCHVNSVNEFYKIIRPRRKALENEIFIRSFRLDTDCKNLIRDFVGEIK